MLPTPRVSQNEDILPRIRAGALPRRTCYLHHNKDHENVPHALHIAIPIRNKSQDNAFDNEKYESEGRSFDIAAPLILVISNCTPHKEYWSNDRFVVKKLTASGGLECCSAEYGNPHYLWQ